MTDTRRRGVTEPEDRRRQLGRCVGAWRRLVIARGPKGALPAAMVIAEHAQLVDGYVCSRPGAELIAGALRVNTRSVERQIAQLVGQEVDPATGNLRTAEAGHWLRPTRRPHPRLAQTYLLAVPDLPPRVILAAYELPAQTWKTLIETPDENVGHSLNARHDQRERPTNLAGTPDKNVGLIGLNWIERIRAQMPDEYDGHSGPLSARSSASVDDEQQRRLEAIRRDIKANELPFRIRAAYGATDEEIAEVRARIVAEDTR